jgi:hypothetical protein
VLVGLQDAAQAEDVQDDVPLVLVSLDHLEIRGGAGGRGPRRSGSWRS